MVKPPMDHVVELVYILTRLVKNLAKCSYYTILFSEYLLTVINWGLNVV